MNLKDEIERIIHSEQQKLEATSKQKAELHESIRLRVASVRQKVGAPYRQTEEHEFRANGMI